MIREILIIGGAWFVAALLSLGALWLTFVTEDWRARRRRRRRQKVDLSRGVMHLPQAEIPGCLRESARTVLAAHGMWVVDRRGELLSDDRMNELLRELGNNATQGLYSVDVNEANFS